MLVFVCFCVNVTKWRRNGDTLHLTFCCILRHSRLELKLKVWETWWSLYLDSLKSQVFVWAKKEMRCFQVTIYSSWVITISSSWIVTSSSSWIVTISSSWVVTSSSSWIVTSYSWWIGEESPPFHKFTLNTMKTQNSVKQFQDRKEWEPHWFFMGVFLMSVGEKKRKQVTKSCEGGQSES